MISFCLVSKSAPNYILLSLSSTTCLFPDTYLLTCSITWNIRSWGTKRPLGWLWTTNWSWPLFSCHPGRGLPSGNRSRHCWNLVALFAGPHRVPLGHRGPLTLQHTVPVGDLIRSGRLFAKDDPAHEVILTFAVVVPHGHDETAGLQLLYCEIEAERLVKNGIYCVLLRGGLSCFKNLRTMTEVELHKGVWNGRNKTSWYTEMCSFKGSYDFWLFIKSSINYYIRPSTNHYICLFLKSSINHYIFYLWISMC